MKMDNFVKLAWFRMPKIVICLSKALKSRISIDFKTYDLNVKVPSLSKYTNSKNWCWKKEMNGKIAYKIPPF